MNTYDIMKVKIQGKEYTRERAITLLIVYKFQRKMNKKQYKELVEMVLSQGAVNEDGLRNELFNQIELHAISYDAALKEFRGIMQ